MAGVFHLSSKNGSVLVSGISAFYLMFFQCKQPPQVMPLERFQDH